MVPRCVLIAGMAAAGLVGCQSAPAPSTDAPPASASQAQASAPTTSPQTDEASASSAPPESGPLAYVGGEAVTRDDLWDPLVEAAGGTVLSNLVLDRAVAARLKQRGLNLTDQQIEAERRRILDSLGAKDQDRATLVLEALRRRRGLGKRRFADLLRRNAGLRLLVRGKVHISDAAIHQAYQRRYGPKYRARLIVTDTLDQARKLRQQATHGKSFTDLASTHSTDPTAARGGLMPPVSLADPGYPRAIRDALAKLKPGRVSGVIALEQGYALLKLERKIKARAVQLADVKKALTKRVRAHLQRVRMRQLAQTMLDEANVVVLDPALSRAWKTRITPAPGVAPAAGEK